MAEASTREKQPGSGPVAAGDPGLALKSLFGLQGKVAIVTGASRGLGKACALALGRCGAHVVCVSRTVKLLEATATELREEGFKASVQPIDCGDEKAIVAGVAAIVAKHGRVDILVNNAGTINHGPITETSLDSWQAVMDVNLNGCFLLARECAAQMVAQKAPGRIINVLSALSVFGRASVHAYVASKHGLHGLTKSMAAELGPKGITVNGIGPGYMRTDITAGIQASPEFDAVVRSRTPVMRWGVPKDMEGAVVFLASAASAYVNGHMLMVDGGFTTSVATNPV